MRPRTVILACFVLGTGVTGLVLANIRTSRPVNPAASPISFSFAVAGDWHNDWNGTGETRKVVTAIAQASPNFAIALGDLAYNDSAAVAKSWCLNYKSIFQNVLVVAGNHESGESNKAPMDVYNEYCPFPNIGASFIPGTIVDDHVTSYGYEYAFDYPADNPIARFILLSPDVQWKCCGLSGNFSYAQGSTNYQWVSNRIAEAKSRGEWVIVGWHKDPMSSVYPSVPQIWKDIWNLMFQKNVDLLLVAHEHVYERTYQLKCGIQSSYCISNNSPSTYQKGGGVEYIIQGTGGAPFHATGSSILFVRGEQSDLDHGFMKYTVSQSSLSGHFVSVDSGFSDGFTINAPAQAPSPSSQELLFNYRLNPLVISDDDQSGLYTSNIPKNVTLADSSTVKVSGQNSLRINIAPSTGTHYPEIMYRFTSPINVSANEFVSVHWYGQDTFLPVSIRMMTTYYSDQFTFDFVDNWEGWGRLIVPTQSFHVLIGAPSWSKISDFAIVVDSAAFTSPVTFYMDRATIDSGLDQFYLAEQNSFL